MLSRFHAITRPKAGEEGGRKIRAIIFTLSLSLFSIAVVASFVFSREKIESIFYLFIYFIAIFSYDVFIFY